MAWGFVQSVTSPTITATPASLAYSGNTTVGNTLFCAICFRNAFFGVQTVAITDDAGNTWTQDWRIEVQNDGTNYKYAELWSTPCTSALLTASSHKVNATFNFAPSVAIMGLLEYSGLASASRLDVLASNFGSNTSPASGATAATGAANELVLGAMLLSENGSNNTTFSSSGYTTRAFGTHAFVDMIWVGDKDSGSSGATPSMSGTLSALSGTERWAALTAVYKLAGGGGGLTAAQISPALLQQRIDGIMGRVDA